MPNPKPNAEGNSCFCLSSALIYGLYTYTRQFIYKELAVDFVTLSLSHLPLSCARSDVGVGDRGRGERARARAPRSAPPLWGAPEMWSRLHKAKKDFGRQ